MDVISKWTMAVAIATVLVSAVITTQSARAAATFTTLHSFDGLDGEGPLAVLVQATDGNLYGTTEFSGTYSGGTVFKITPGGT